MTEQFNRILKAFGANRVELLHVDNQAMDIEILNWGKFVLYSDRIYEAVGWQFLETARSRWLHAISLGKKRDEEGNIQ